MNELRGNEAGDDGRPDNGAAGAAERMAYARREPVPPGGLLEQLGLAMDRPRSRPVRRKRLALIAQKIEADILPRLVLAHREVAPLLESAAPSGAELDRLTALLVQQDRRACLALLDQVQRRGVARPAVCLGLLAPAARRLGELWSEDRCSFADVTLGLGILGHMLQAMPEAVEPLLPQSESGRRLLLTSLADEQHSLGLAMVADFFRNAGWAVTVEPAQCDAGMAALVRDSWFAIVGLTVSTDDRLPALAQAIRAVRAASRHRAVGIMAGGPPFVDHPELALRVGADVTARDGDQAVLRAEGLRALLSVSG